MKAFTIFTRNASAYLNQVAQVVLLMHLSVVIAQMIHGPTHHQSHFHWSHCSRGEELRSSRCDCLLLIVCLLMFLIALVNNDLSIYFKNGSFLLHKPGSYVIELLLYYVLIYIHFWANICKWMRHRLRFSPPLCGLRRSRDLILSRKMSCKLVILLVSYLSSAISINWYLSISQSIDFLCISLSISLFLKNRNCTWRLLADNQRWVKCPYRSLDK